MIMKYSLYCGGYLTTGWELGMKKSYEAPVLVKREALAHVAATVKNVTLFQNVVPVE